jgi:hypothetical protein
MFLERMLESMGAAGAIISVLMSVIAALSTVIVTQWRHSNKVYGYRLAERDTLNKAMTEGTSALHSLLEVQSQRNELMDQQADLIAKQAIAVEMLRVLLLSQYEQIRDHQSGLNQAVTSIAESLRHLSSLIVDDRNAQRNHISEIKLVINGGNQALITELRQLVGGEVTLIHRRKKSP